MGDYCGPTPVTGVVVDMFVTVIAFVVRLRLFAALEPFIAQ